MGDDHAERQRCVRRLVLELVRLVVLAVLYREKELLELSRPNAKISESCRIEMADTDAEAVVDILVGPNEHLWQPSTWQTPEKTTFGTDCSDLLGEQLQKLKAKALLMFKQTTASGIETSLYFLLTLTVTSKSIVHAQLADSSKRSFASKSSNSSSSSSSRTGASIQMHPKITRRKLKLDKHFITVPLHTFDQFCQNNKQCF